MRLTRMPQVGDTLSKNTLRVQDLLNNFASGLLYYAPDDEEAKRLALEAFQYAALLEQEWNDELAEQAAFVLDDIADALDSIAPENAYFGAHWGDGAEFGFWPTDEESE